MFGTCDVSIFWNGKVSATPDYIESADEPCIDLHLDNGKVDMKLYMPLSTAEALATAIDQACQDYRRVTQCVGHSTGA